MIDRFSNANQSDFQVPAPDFGTFSAHLYHFEGNVEHLDTIAGAV